MFGMMFQAKVLGVLQQDFNWDIMEPISAFNHFYKTPLKTFIKSLKAKGGNEYDVAIYFVISASKGEFEVDGSINPNTRLGIIPQVAHLATFGEALREEAMNIRLGL